MRNLDELLGDSGMRLMVRAEMVTATASYTVVDDGWAILTGMGGGAGGSRSAAPGNSAPWGVKMVAVRAGDVIDFVIGAGGGVAVADGSPAPAGGTTLVRQNGATLMTCQGGDAGPASPTARSPVAATVTGADFWLRGRQPMGGGVAPMAGAAVDLGGKTYNLNTSTGDHAVALAGGVDGQPRGAYVWPWDITLFGGAAGDPGVGAPNNSALSGMFAGGSGSTDTSTKSAPGRGASAGRGDTGARNGGDGLGYIRLFKRLV